MSSSSEPVVVRDIIRVAAACYKSIRSYPTTSNRGTYRQISQLPFQTDYPVVHDGPQERVLVVHVYPPQNPEPLPFASLPGVWRRRIGEVPNHL